MYGSGKLPLVGCLGSEPRVTVAEWCYATFVMCLGEAAAPGGGRCGPCPDFESNTLAFALQLRKITENTGRVTEVLSADQRPARFV